MNGNGGSPSSAPLIGNRNLGAGGGMDGEGQYVLGPDTTITGSPKKLSRRPEDTFEFGSNKDDVKYQCSLDGGPFTPCPDTLVLAQLPETEHTLRVRAIDSEGNDDLTPATYTWTRSLLDTTIDQAPEELTLSPEARFTFDSNAPNARYECSVDQGPFQKCDATSTFTVTEEGPHTIEVRAVDSEEADIKDLSPASYTWTYRHDMNFLGGGTGCSAAGGSSSALAMMGLAVLSTLLARRRQR